MIGDNAIVAAQSETKNNVFAHIALDISGNLVTMESFIGRKDTIRVVNEATMNLSYKPGYQRKTWDKPYLLTAKIFKKGMKRFADYNDFLEQIKTDEELQFVIKYYHIDEELFEIAKEVNPLVTKIDFNTAQYRRDLKKKAEEQGIERKVSVLYIEEMILAARERAEIFNQTQRDKNRENNAKSETKRRAKRRLEK